MQQTFIQKVILTIILGFVAACLIYIFNTFFDGVEKSAGNFPKNKTSQVH